LKAVHRLVAIARDEKRKKESLNSSGSSLPAKNYTFSYSGLGSESIFDKKLFYDILFKKNKYYDYNFFRSDDFILRSADFKNAESQQETSVSKHIGDANVARVEYLRALDSAPRTQKGHFDATEPELIEEKEFHSEVYPYYLQHTVHKMRYVKNKKIVKIKKIRQARKKKFLKPFFT
jgi:hypothetical protein